MSAVTPPENQSFIADANPAKALAPSAAGVALIVIGSIGPWLSAFGESAGGLDKDGKITIVAALTLLIAIVDINDVKSFEGLGAKVGWGLWLVLIGSIVLLANTILRRIRG